MTKYVRTVRRHRFGSTLTADVDHGDIYVQTSSDGVHDASRWDAISELPIREA